MRSFLSWMRQVLPRDTIVALAVCSDIAVELVYLWSRFWWGSAEESLFAGYRLFIQLLAALFYGGHRVATFHPAYDAEYRKWLECTPWTPRHPLPMGPLHLVLQDVVVLTASMILTRISDARVLYIPAVFLSSYCLSLAVVVWSTGQKFLAYALGAALGLVIVFVQNPVGALLSSMAATLITPVAIRRSLAAFPWELPWYADGRSWQQMVEDYKQRQWGWPVDVFAPKVPHAWITPIDGLGASLLVGWWFFAVYHQVDEKLHAVLLSFWIQGLSISAIVRLGVYFKNHRPPISIPGRIFTLRPWQAGFDHVFLAPLAAVSLGIVAMILAIFASQAWPVAALWGLVLPRWSELPIATAGVALSLMILLLGGPPLERWRLAGRHRIVFQLTGKTTGLGSTEKNQEFIQIA